MGKIHPVVSDPLTWDVIETYLKLFKLSLNLQLTNNRNILDLDSNNVIFGGYFSFCYFLLLKFWTFSTTSKIQIKFSYLSFIYSNQNILIITNTFTVLEHDPTKYRSVPLKLYKDSIKNITDTGMGYA